MTEELKPCPSDVLEAHNRLGQLLDAAGLPANHPALLDWAKVGFHLKSAQPAEDARMVEVVAPVLEMLGDCWHDHAGYCQAHFCEAPCRVETAREAIRKAMERQAK